jgi:hypothetical protein
VAFTREPHTESAVLSLRKWEGDYENWGRSVCELFKIFLKINDKIRTEQLRKSTNPVSIKVFLTEVRTSYLPDCKAKHYLEAFRFFDDTA